MSVHRRMACYSSILVAFVFALACTTEMDRPRVGEALTKTDGQAAWGDDIWGPSIDPLPETFVLIDPEPPETGWELLADWNGNGKYRTELFSVDEEWQIVWQSGAREGERPLSIKAFAIPGDVLVANVSQDGESQVSALHLRGGGTFYLEVEGDGGPWQVSIEVPAPAAGRDN